MAATGDADREENRRKVVLVVDDSVELLAAVRLMLEPHFDVLQASDLRDQPGAWDVIILSEVLEHQSAFQVELSGIAIRRIRITY